MHCNGRRELVFVDLHHIECTRDALKAARKRGVELGGLRPGTITRNDAAKDRATAEAEKLRPLLAPMVVAGYSLRKISEALAGAGTVTRNAPCLPQGCETRCSDWNYPPSNVPSILDSYNR